MPENTRCFTLTPSPSRRRQLPARLAGAIRAERSPTADVSGIPMVTGGRVPSPTVLAPVRTRNLEIGSEGAMYPAHLAESLAVTEDAAMTAFDALAVPWCLAALSGGLRS